MVGRNRTWEGYKNSKKGDRVDLTCEICGAIKSILISQLRFRKNRNRHFHCSRKCYYKSLIKHGRELGLKYGWKALEKYREAKEQAKQCGAIVDKTMKLEKLRKLIQIYADEMKYFTKKILGYAPYKSKCCLARILILDEDRSQCEKCGESNPWYATI